jgi:dTMP kinase
MKNFITIEGAEGVGKSTQLRLLSEYLTARGIDTVVTREPGGGKISEKIRGIILDKQNDGMSDKCELLLYLAARAQHIKDVIEPSLRSKRLVICDRYIDSTYAYQGAARGLGAEFIDSLNRLTVGEFYPCLTIFLDAPPSVCFARKGGADKNDRLELLNIAFHNKVYEGYKQLLKKEPDRFVAVDATGTKADTHKKIIELLIEKGIV